MSRVAQILQQVPPRWDESLGWAAGLGFTALIFVSLARVERTPTPAAEIEDIRRVALPFEAPPPPPPPPDTPAPPEDATPLIGLDPGPEDSPVHLRTLPPDFATLLAAPLAPKRIDPLGLIRPDGKPRAEVEDPNRIFQQSDLDEPVRPLVRPPPVLSTDDFGKAKALRIVLLLTIDTNGQVVNARIISSSGEKRFDNKIVQAVKGTWLFSPGTRRGKRVRCLVEQPFHGKLTHASPFSIE